MSYKARRKQERQTKAQKTEHIMSEPPPIARHDKNAPLPDRVPLRLDGRTVTDVRVSKLEADPEHYAQLLRMSVPELRALIAARRYTPEPTAKGGELRAPSWYVSDMYSLPGNGLFFD